MDNLLTSLKGVLYERISSPLFGSFAIAWGIFNWKFIALLFLGNEKAIDRLNQINEIKHPFDCKYIDYFLLPLIISLLYIFVYQFISRPIYKFYKEYLESLQKLRMILRKINC